MLTEQQIRDMEPGRDLDALVAEHVMGFVRADDDWTKLSGWKKGENGWTSAFKASTDISAAWEVVEKLRKTHWVDVRGGLKLEYVGPYMCEIGVYGVPGALYAEGDTAPEAICKAALIAHMRGGSGE